MECLVHDYGRADPEKNRQGKFVQLHFADQEHICLAPKHKATFHANIVEIFCRNNKVGFFYNEKKDLLFADESLAVVGGGRFVIDDLGCSLKLFGTSVGYGPFDRKGLRDRLLGSDGLKGYTVIIEP